ncbi:MAG: hypothetical protein WDO56_32910 [Gammaproteobacteria bacterium]
MLKVGELPAYGWVPPGVHDYTPQSFDYAKTPIADRITEAPQALRRRGLFRGKATPVRASLQLR